MTKEKERDFEYEVARAKAAYESILPRLKSIPNEFLLPMNVDLQAVATVALGVSAFTAEPEIRASFVLLNELHFDPRLLDDLTVIAWAAWYARTEGFAALAVATNAMIPAALVTSAGELKARMMKVVSYHLEEVEDVALELADIRQGTGYQDLATDLMRFAKLYEVNAELLSSRDKHFYSAADVSESRSIATKMITALGQAGDSQAKVWADTQARIWYLLRTTYDEVAEAGQFIFRKDSSKRDRFVSLFSSTRNRTSSKAKSGSGEKSTTDGGAQDGESTDSGTQGA